MHQLVGKHVLQQRRVAVSPAVLVAKHDRPSRRQSFEHSPRQPQRRQREHFGLVVAVVDRRVERHRKESRRLQLDNLHIGRSAAIQKADGPRSQLIRPACAAANLRRIPRATAAPSICASDSPSSARQMSRHFLRQPIQTSQRRQHAPFEQLQRTARFVKTPSNRQSPAAGSLVGGPAHTTAASRS